MAIIIGSEIKKAELQNIELDYNMEIDLINKILKKMENFPTVVMEDNNSISIVMKAPLEYNGVDLMGTNCIVKYNTSWVDENGKNSAGQVDLTNTCIEKQDYLLYTWVLDINQTLKTGVCNFNVIFLMNLEEDPYINNTNVFITDEIEGELSYDSNIVIETNLKYWTISTKPEAINIQNSFSNIESDYNLILPENFAEELQKTNEKVENIEIDISSAYKKIENNEKEISSAYEKIENNEKEIQANKLNIENNKTNIEKCATKEQLITEIATVADIATEAYNKSEQAIDDINNLPKQQDYIVGYGETIRDNVTWKWEKWSSGKAVCWGTREYAVNFSIAAGGNGWYSTEALGPVRFPFSFIEMPLCLINQIGGIACTIMSDTATYPSKTQTQTFFGTRYNSVNSTSVMVGFYAIGKWK